MISKNLLTISKKQKDTPGGRIWDKSISRAPIEAKKIKQTSLVEMSQTLGQSNGHFGRLYFAASERIFQNSALRPNIVK